MKRLWGTACKRFGSYTKWVGMVMWGSVLTGCAHDLGPPDEVATVKAIIGRFVANPRDRTDIHVAVHGIYAVSSWMMSDPDVAADNTTYLKKVQGNGRFLAQMMTESHTVTSKYSGFLRMWVGHLYSLFGTTPPIRYEDNSYQYEQHGLRSI